MQHHPHITLILDEDTLLLFIFDILRLDHQASLRSNCCGHRTNPWNHSGSCLSAQSWCCGCATWGNDDSSYRRSYGFVCFAHMFECEPSLVETRHGLAVLYLLLLDRLRFLLKYLLDSICRFFIHIHNAFYRRWSDGQAAQLINHPSLSPVPLTSSLAWSSRADAWWNWRELVSFAGTSLIR